MWARVISPRPAFHCSRTSRRKFCGSKTFLFLSLSRERPEERDVKRRQEEGHRERDADAVRHRRLLTSRKGLEKMALISSRVQNILPSCRALTKHESGPRLPKKESCKSLAASGWSSFLLGASRQKSLSASCWPMRPTTSMGMRWHTSLRPWNPCACVAALFEREEDTVETV